MPDYRMKWIRIWPHSWFDSSMRVELTNAERAFWVDVIALAGKSRIPGVICSDPDGNAGYPLPMLCSMLVSWTPEEVARILDKLEKTNRVQVTRSPLLSGDDGWIVRVVNWDKYQSEAQRIQKYRNTARAVHRNSRHATPGGCTSGRLEVEVEVDKKKPPAACAACRDYAFQCFEKKYGHKPMWGKADYVQLARLFREHPNLMLEEFSRRWDAYMNSNDAFIQAQAGSLKWFCTHLDRFVRGNANARPATVADARSQRNAEALNRVFGGAEKVAGDLRRTLPPAGNRTLSGGVHPRPKGAKPDGA